MCRVNLKKLRIDKGDIYQADLAKLLNCSQSYLSQVENGVRKLSQEYVDKLIELFGDITPYFIDENGASVIQNNENGDNIFEHAKTCFANCGEELVKANAEIDALRKEVQWLRGLVEKLTVGKQLN